jgi:hypothetical protein
MDPRSLLAPSVLRAHVEGVAGMSEPTSWYLQSMGDADTHRGELNSDGTVSAVCGVCFRPIELPYEGVSLPGYPLDPEQVCPACASAGTR